MLEMNRLRKSKMKLVEVKPSKEFDIFGNV